MKKYLIYIIIFLLIPISQKAQKISNISFDEIKQSISDSSSFYYYPRMLDMMKKNIVLTPQEYKYLYYGNVFQTYYNPYSTPKDYEKFSKLIEEEKFNEAIPYGKKVLKQNPINLNALFKMLVCYHYQGIKDSAQIYAGRYYSFINVILASGDGKSSETAYVVNCVNDEYQILYYLNLKPKIQALAMQGLCDKFKLDTKKQKKIKGQKKIKEIYFNIKFPWDSLSRRFEKN